MSLVGILTLSIKHERLKKWLIYFVSFSAGALMGGAFLHMLPELVETEGFSLLTSFMILGGIVSFFVLEKIIHWHHDHIGSNEHHHTFAIMNMFGDGFHNFLDGLVIAASYLVNTELGVAVTLAVILHEVPQEIGDFGILLHAGYSKSKALLFNFISALAAVLGAVVALVLTNYIENIEFLVIPIAIGGFIYVAGSDLIPELHKEFSIKKAIIQTITIILGIVLMAALLFLE